MNRPRCWCGRPVCDESLESNPLCEDHLEAEEVRKDMAFLRGLRLMAEDRERLEEEAESSLSLENR